MPPAKTTLVKTSGKPISSQEPNSSAKSKSAASTKTIKYTDKSAGQPELIPIFDSIKVMLKPYVTGNLRERGQNSGIYNLVSEKFVEVKGRQRKEVYFASIIIQKGYVGFYYMPVYVNTDLKKVLKPELLKTLKGKSCFHIKKNDPIIMNQIKESLQIGYEMYKQRGWV